MVQQGLTIPFEDRQYTGRFLVLSVSCGFLDILIDLRFLYHSFNPALALYSPCIHCTVDRFCILLWEI